MSKLVWSLSLFIVIGSACARSPTSKEHVALAYALGGKGDRSYNDAASGAVGVLKSRGVVVDEYEPSSMEDYSRGLEALAARRPAVVFCVGFLYEEPVKRTAPKYPGIDFVILDGSFSAAPNVTSVKFLAFEGSRLAGHVAAQATRTRHVAFIGGMDIPVIREFRDGFAAGIRDAASDVNLASYFLGTGGSAFTDPVRGREVALSAIAAGADVLYHAAGTSGNGVIQAARERGVWAIGVDVDQGYLAPSTVLTSMLKRLDVAIVRVTDLRQRVGRLGGKSLSFGLADSAVALTPLSSAAMVPAPRK
ncbi:MAG: BMP family ABC transporter substrate-binding protein [Gemmatimonas sp.]|nr:BMP family ABC transporter substrate-binding protein [Gemmatimonas sp.]